MRKNLRHIVGAALIGALMFGLGGCSIFSKFQGQSAEQATEQLRSVEGLDGTIRVDGAYSGFSKRTFTVSRVMVSSNYEIANMDLFADWLLRLLWSVNDEKTNTTLMFHVTFDDQPPNFDWGGEQAFLDLGFSTTEADSTDSAILITISSDEVEKNLGGWPGKVPEIPEGMLTRVSE